MDSREHDDSNDDVDMVRPGRVLTGPQAVAAGVALALLVILGVGSAFALGGGSDDGAVTTETTHEEHIEVDPQTDEPIEDPCDLAPEMCGEDAGGDTGACDEPGMCGDISPDGPAEEIDASTGECGDELCGDVGPGTDDPSGP